MQILRIDLVSFLNRIFTERILDEHKKINLVDGNLLIGLETVRCFVTNFYKGKVQGTILAYSFLDCLRLFPEVQINEDKLILNLNHKEDFLLDLKVRLLPLEQNFKIVPETKSIVRINLETDFLKRAVRIFPELTKGILSTSFLVFIQDKNLIVLSPAKVLILNKKSIGAGIMVPFKMIDLLSFLECEGGIQFWEKDNIVSCMINDVNLQVAKTVTELEGRKILDFVTDNLEKIKWIAKVEGGILKKSLGYLRILDEIVEMNFVKGEIRIKGIITNLRIPAKVYSSFHTFNCNLYSLLEFLQDDLVEIGVIDEKFLVFMQNNDFLIFLRQKKDEDNKE